MSSLNTLTGLTDIIYEAADVVAREQVGFIPSVTMDASAASAALNQTIRSHVAPATSLVSITPASYAPDAGGQTVSYVDLSITNNKMAPIQWTGDEQKSLGNKYGNVVRDQFAQGFRALTNAVEADLAAAAAAGASRAYGTAATSPFGTANDLSDAANAQRILDDNGAPMGDRSLVLTSAAMANLRGKQAVLFKANEAGTDALLRQGVVGLVEGLNVRNTRQGQSHTAGTGASYVVDGTGNTAAGSLIIKAKTGTGTILVGDVVTIGSYKYVVTVALAGGLFTIAAPGLQAAVADGDTITLAATHSINTAFHKSGILLASRVPAMPAGGDGASDVMEVVDPVSGLVFQVAMYKGYRQVRFEIGLAWGVKVVKPEFVATLLG
jgi:hypothetical protein